MGWTRLKWPGYEDHDFTYQISLSRPNGVACQGEFAIEVARAYDKFLKVRIASLFRVFRHLFDPALMSYVRLLSTCGPPCQANTSSGGSPKTRHSPCETSGWYL